MLNKYRSFLNSSTTEILGDLPLKLKGTYRISKWNKNAYYLKLSINLGYEIVSLEKFESPENIEKSLIEFINKYFTSIEEYELDDLYILAGNLIEEKIEELDMYDYLEENIITEFENTFYYDVLKEKYPNEIIQICNIYVKIYERILNDIENECN